MGVPNTGDPTMETIHKDLTEFFRNADMAAEHTGPKHDSTYYQDARIRAENRLRQVVGAPMIARKSW